MKFTCHTCEQHFGEEWLAPLWVLEPDGPAKRNLCLECIRTTRPALMDALDGSRWIMELTLLALASPTSAATPHERTLHNRTSAAMRDPDVRGAYLEMIAEIMREVEESDEAEAEAG